MRDTFLMTEHPAWRINTGVRVRVFAVDDHTRWMVSTSSGELALERLAGYGQAPKRDTFTPPAAIERVPDLASSLQNLGMVTRFRNPNLWEAIATGIMRQVIRASQSKKLFRAFCDTYGERITLPDGKTYSLFPTPENVLRLTDDELDRTGLKFQRPALHAAAEAYLDHGVAWRELTPMALISALCSVRRIGPWTAKAATADWSNDWSLYPYEDLAVRTWAKRAAPSHEWPSDQAAFARTWREITGEHLGSLTLMTLAWGSQHGDIG